MMRLGRRATLLVAFSLLASAATAYAEDSNIESEPIPLDSTDPRYSGYLGQVREMIKAKWAYPCVKNVTTAQCEYKSARLVVLFAIGKDGRVAKVQVQESSGYEIYDEYAVNAVNSASPFPPVPPELIATAKPGSAGVRIVAPFTYVDSIQAPRFRLLPDTVDPREPKGGTR
jgi:TonB family protein